MSEQNVNEQAVQPAEDIDALRQVRLDKLAEMQQSGNDPFTITKFDVTASTADCRAMYEAEQDMKIPTELLPKCPVCGKPVSMNLRADDTFVEDEGWHRAALRYQDFLNGNKDRNIVYLELGVGANTPVIIKYPFWRETQRNANAVYACLNFDEACCPKEIESRSICLDGDSGEVLKDLMGGMTP